MVTQQSKQQAERVMSSVKQAMSQPTEMVKEYPVSSMLVVFGVGMGLGVVLSQALIPSFHQPTMTERMGGMTERMGRQLYDGMCDLTGALSRGLHMQS